jgi:hypothetical protein
MISSDHFIDVDDSLLEFLEIQGEKAVDEIYQSNKTNQANGYRLLNILIIGIGSSFLLFTRFNVSIYMSAAIMLFFLGWSACSFYLALNVLRAKKRFTVNTPPNLLYNENYKGLDEKDYQDLEKKGYSGNRTPLSILRRYRLKGLSDTSNQMLIMNSEIGKSLNRVIIACILTPIASILVSAIFYLLV